MIARIAIRNLLYKKARFAFTALGLGTLFLLSAAQVGMMIGWINTITEMITHADADIWIMAQNPSPGITGRRSRGTGSTSHATSRAWQGPRGFTSGGACGSARMGGG